MFKLVLEKAEEPEIKLPTSVGSSKKQECSRTTSISALLTMPKPLTVWITINCGKFFKRWDYQTKLHWKISPRDELDLFVFGSDDLVHVASNSPDPNVTFSFDSHIYY